MKLFNILLFSLIIILFSCKKDDTSYSLRVKNEKNSIVECKISGVDFGRMFSGGASNFKDVPSKNLKLTGDISGSVSLGPGKESDKYTLILNESGTFTVVTGYYNEVRVFNECSQSINCVVEGVDFGSVPAYQKSIYKRVPFGEVHVTGDLVGTLPLPTVNMSTFDEKFTIEITSSFGVVVWWSTYI